MGQQEQWDRARLRDQDVLEAMVDRYGLSSVLDTLANVCYSKSEHIIANWRDKELARQWERHGDTIGRTAARVDE